jgi:hypothetical protein
MMLLAVVPDIFEHFRRELIDQQKEQARLEQENAIKYDLWRSSPYTVVDLSSALRNLLTSPPTTKVDLESFKESPVHSDEAPRRYEAYDTSSAERKYRETMEIVPSKTLTIGPSRFRSECVCGHNVQIRSLRPRNKRKRALIMCSTFVPKCQPVSIKLR